MNAFLNSSEKDVYEALNTQRSFWVVQNFSVDIKK